MFDFARLGKHKALCAGLFPCQGMKHGQRKEGWIPMFSGASAKQKNACNGGSVYIKVTFTADISEEAERHLDRDSLSRARSFHDPNAFKSQLATESRGEGSTTRPSQSLRVMKKSTEKAMGG